VIVGLAENDPEAKARFAAFRQGFEKLGWIEGRNIRFNYRYAPAGSRVQALARELIALQPEVILAQGTPISAALKQETSTVPVVFVGNVDPVGSGFVASLAQPGGNLTGFMSLEASITVKWLGMLKEIAPNLKRAALVSNPKTIPFDYFYRAAEAAAPALGIELVPGRVENVADIERFIESFARTSEGGLIFPPDTTTVVNRERIIGLAAQYRLPAVYAFRAHVLAGGLMSYGTDFVPLSTSAIAHRALIVELAAQQRLPAIYPNRLDVTSGGLISYGPDGLDQYRRVAGYIDRILKGEKPADLPVQNPTKYELVINLKTAKLLGLDVPPTLLARADEVIE
jgi:putative ABC transport system substrate-binding protein